MEIILLLDVSDTNSLIYWKLIIIISHELCPAPGLPGAESFCYSMHKHLLVH